MEPDALVHYRYRAVCEVLGGAPPSEVAQRFGTSRQSLHTWRRRFEQEGLPGLADRPRRPKTSPTRLPAPVEAFICELRRQHPRWGARRLSYELRRGEVQPAPSRATVHRVLVRNGLINHQEQSHPRVYKRWQRAEPMHLWQLDLVGWVPLADGRRCKLLTGIDDHSRFVVIAAVLTAASARMVCESFSQAMRRYGVPAEVLTDNGRQFTGRFTKPQPVEVLFERICRENGITARLTKPRSPTTTGKIERWHQTLRRELLDHVTPFATLAAAQEAIDAWVQTYNYSRPHQSLDMATPASRFRPNGPTRIDPPSDHSRASAPPLPASPEVVRAIEPPPAPPPTPDAVELERTVPPGGLLTIAGQTVQLGQSWAGQTVTVWADQRSLHVAANGQVRTFTSRLSQEQLPRVDGQCVLPSGHAIEISRNVRRYGFIIVTKQSFLVGREHARRQVTVRLDGHLMHAICDGALVRTWPCPVPIAELAQRFPDAQAPTSPLPPAPAVGPFQVQRRVSSMGQVTVAGQRLHVARACQGQLVTIVVEDTHFRVLRNGEELKLIPRRTGRPITHVNAHSRMAGRSVKHLPRTPRRPASQPTFPVKHASSTFRQATPEPTQGHITLITFPEPVGAAAASHVIGRAASTP